MKIYYRQKGSIIKLNYLPINQFISPQSTYIRMFSNYSLVAVIYYPSASCVTGAMPKPFDKTWTGKKKFKRDRADFFAVRNIFIKVINYQCQKVSSLRVNQWLFERGSLRYFTWTFSTTSSYNATAAISVKLITITQNIKWYHCT